MGYFVALETRVLQRRRSTLSSHVQPGLQFTYALSKQDKEIETSFKLVRIWREIEDTHISPDCLLQGQGLRTKKRAWKTQIFINVGLTSAFCLPLHRLLHGVSILGEIFLERGANLESRAAHTHPNNTQVPPRVLPLI